MARYEPICAHMYPKGEQRMSITEYMNKLQVHDKWKSLVEYIYYSDLFQIDLLGGAQETDLENIILNMGQRLSIEIKESSIPFTLEVNLENADLILTMLGGHVKPGLENWCKSWVKGANEVALYGFYWKIQNDEFLILKNVFSMVTSLTSEEFVDTVIDLIDYGSEMVYFIHKESK